MDKDFDSWNNLKKRTNKENSRFYVIREIWWCRFGTNIGTEQDGKGRWYTRPCLVLRGFGPNACLVAPLTTSFRRHPLRIPIGSIDNKENKVNISQIRVIDTRRFMQRIGFLEKSIFKNVIKTIRELF